LKHDVCILTNLVMTISYVIDSSIGTSVYTGRQ